LFHPRRSRAAMKTLIAGIGNIFLGDDAFGSVLASRLAARSWPEGVAVRDFGIRCLELAYAILDDWDEVILLDAAPRGGRPGTLYRIALDGEPAAADVDPHTISAAMVLGMARRIGGRRPRASPTTNPTRAFHPPSPPPCPPRKQ